MRLSHKLTIMLLIPITGLIWFAQNEVRQTLAMKAESENLLQLFELSVVSSALLHELQTERGASAGFLGGHGESFVTQLPARRRETDKKLIKYAVFLGAFPAHSYSVELRESLDRTANALNMLQSIREQVIELHISAADAVDFYSGVNEVLLDLIGLLPRLSSVGELNNSITAYSSFPQAKEHAGLERAVVSNVFARNGFAPGFSQRLSQHVSGQRDHLEVFLALASLEQKEFFERKLRDPSVTETERMRAIAFMAIRKAELIGDFNRIAGYGGLIHLFKNYVLRDQQSYVVAFDQKHRVAIQTLAKISQLDGLSAISVADVQTVREAIDANRRALDRAIELHRDTPGIAEIDDALIIDDGPALIAIAELSKGDLGVDPEYWFGTMTHKISLSKVIEGRLSNDLRLQGIAIRDHAISQNITASVVTFLALGLAVVLGVSLMRTVMRQPGADPVHLEAVVAAIAGGDLHMDLDQGRSSSGVFRGIEVSAHVFRRTGVDRTFVWSGVVRD